MLNKHEIVYNFKQPDITDQVVVNENISALKPEMIYHCVVDNAEEIAKDLNWQVNADGTRNVAEAAKRVGAKMVYISTDYVFDGINEGEYEVDAPTNPRNEYGKAKLAGEKAIQETLTDYYIIRTSWVLVNTVRILSTQCFVLPKTMISSPSLTINLAAQRGLEP